VDQTAVSIGGVEKRPERIRTEGRQYAEDGIAAGSRRKHVSVIIAGAHPKSTSQEHLPKHIAGEHRRRPRRSGESWVLKMKFS